MTDPDAKFRGLSVGILRRAVEVYLRHAYPDGPVPEVVRRRLNWSDAPEVRDLLACAPFEPVTVASDPRHSPIYSLRLGNHSYPHMKLQVQAWDTPAGYLLTVNTHDQIMDLDPNAPGAAEFRELQIKNRTLKEAIEQDWDREGLPNFHRYLRECLTALEDQESGDSASSTALT